VGSFLAQPDAEVSLDDSEGNPLPQPESSRPIHLGHCFPGLNLLGPGGSHEEMRVLMIYRQNRSGVKLKVFWLCRQTCAGDELDVLFPIATSID
jgi:hypothetical protein